MPTKSEGSSADRRSPRNRFWTLSPLDFRYYGADNEFFHRLYPYVSEEAYIKYQLKVEATLATTLANSNWQLCSIEQADEIINACEQVTASEVYEEEERVNHAVRALVNCIQRKVTAKAKPYVHLFATSNDITDSASALRLKELTINVIVPDLVELEMLLISLARKYANVPQIGRTHGQHAEPITFGFALASYVSRLLGRIQRIIDCAENLQGKFSGSVGAYNALSLIDESNAPLFEQQLLDKLGLKRSERYISTQIVQPEYLTDLAYSVISCFSVLANLADDIRHLHRTEIAEVEQAYNVQDIGSSTMPHKVNPKNFEQVKSMWKMTMPRMVTVFMDQISEHQRDLTNSASGRFLIELFVAFDYSTNRLVSAFEMVKANAENMRTNLETSMDRLISEPLYILLALNGFSEAYRRVRELVEESETTKIPIAELIWEKHDIRPILQKLRHDQVETLKDPTKYVGVSRQRALETAAQAEESIVMILGSYIRGSVDASSLVSFREERRPSYENMRALHENVTTPTDSVKIFFYGSFMDLEVLRTLGVVPRTFETAELKNWNITFSPMATLDPSEGDSVYGIIAELSRAEVRTLYSRDDLKHYKPVDITAATKRNKHAPAQCYISKPRTGQKPSVEYLQRVIHAAENLGFPPAYLTQLRRTPTTQTSNS